MKKHRLLTKTDYAFFAFLIGIKCLYFIKQNIISILI